MIEALSFLGSRGPVARDANMLLACAWARFKPAHMFSWHLRVSSRC